MESRSHVRSEKTVGRDSTSTTARDDRTGPSTSSRVTAAALQDHLVRSLGLGGRRRPARPVVAPTLASFVRGAGPRHGSTARATRATLTLAQRYGLVEAPPPPLSEREWRAVRDISRQREEEACAICLEAFGIKDQVLLSCSHTFHYHCLNFFERYIPAHEDVACPICRHPSYEKVIINDAARLARKRAAVGIQAAWRGYAEKQRYRQWRRDNAPTHPILRRKWLAKRLQEVTFRATQRALLLTDETAVSATREIGVEAEHGHGAATTSATPTTSRRTGNRSDRHPLQATDRQPAGIPTKVEAVRAARRGVRPPSPTSMTRNPPATPTLPLRSPAVPRAPPPGHHPLAEVGDDVDAFMSMLDATLESTRRECDKAVVAAVVRRAERGQDMDPGLMEMLREQQERGLRAEAAAAEALARHGAGDMGRHRQRRADRMLGVGDTTETGAEEGRVGSEGPSSTGVRPHLVDPRLWVNPVPAEDPSSVMPTAASRMEVNWDQVLESALARGALDDDCPVCLSGLRREHGGRFGNSLGWLSCGHVFHTECLGALESFDRVRGRPCECPICRQTYKKRYMTIEAPATRPAIGDIVSN